MKMKQLHMHQSHWDTMRAHVQACVPNEGCGMLAGTGDSVQEVFLITNSAQSPTRFRMDGVEQLRAFSSMEDRSLELLGIFHSHPGESPAESPPAQGPSATDVREAAYPVVHVIWSRRKGQWQGYGFWIEGGTISEVPLFISPAE